MIELAQKKMPNAHLYQGDFSKGLVESLLQHTYDFIIATYSLHHLTDDEKIQFIQLLKEGGCIPVSYTHLDVYKRQGQIRHSLRSL